MINCVRVSYLFVLFYMRIKIFKCRGTRKPRNLRLGTSIIADLGLVRCPEDLSKTAIVVRRILKRYNKFSEKDLKNLIESYSSLILTKHCFLVLNISNKIVQKYLKLRRIDNYLLSYRGIGCNYVSELIRPSINPDDSLDDFDDDLYLELSEKGFDVESEDSEFIGNIKLSDILGCFLGSRRLVDDIKDKYTDAYTINAWIFKALNSPLK